MSSPSAAIQPDQETDTNVMVGPRKCRPTRRVTDNADPLAHKRAKRTPKTTVEDVSEPDPPSPTQPRNRRRVLEASDGSDDDGSSDLDVRELEVNDVDKEANASSVLEEDDDTELARLRKEWDSPIYVFFKPLPAIEYIDGCKAHV
ncbi:hypothetical protein EDB84DRAFT_1567873 [Lactarius hengduanensis]|nr:hypothetical protein EDB84DRAFT_1567873 [Lactarius hengduanensis]